MSNRNLEKYYDVLEVDNDASVEEITRAYNHLKNLYTSGSMAIDPIDNEWDEHDKQDILEKIEEAYEKLLSPPAEDPVIEEGELEREAEVIMPDEEDTLTDAFVDPGPVSGRIFSEAREARGLSFHELSESTQIPPEMLDYIEREAFDKLPEAGYLRWYITTYAKTLSIEPKQCADKYMARYREWKKNVK